MAGPLGFELMWAPRHPTPSKRLHGPLLLVGPCSWWAPRLQLCQPYGQCGTDHCTDEQLATGRQSEDTGPILCQVKLYIAIDRKSEWIKKKIGVGPVYFRTGFKQKAHM